MTKKIEYSNRYFAGNHEALVAKLRGALSDFRFEHVLRVEAKALEFAEHLGVKDFEQVSVAALVHDYAKERSAEEFQQVIVAKHLDPDLLNWGNAIWHGVVGAEMIHDELQVTDEDILNAVRRHTTGDVFMTTLDKIIYMADYIEDGRDFPGVDEVREVTFNNIDEGVAWQTGHTLNYLMAKQALIYPKTILTYNAWVAQK
ncbi:HD domain-containing protein [Periweissella cryptocerci]|uniref:bis(5'-nucleosyl)-tetraphosphatase (symmetrical) n=1 Tax=Periweissella cryptocerci TaxID=2506420 RepID=A0A4P6YVL7_9LACO|nr:bis(5'-nucleosyl)-tetraphosphatase (symmetrical) YqeK [Periweissella cryptocerci]QBO36767.1 HD domain-containing protein [Periweissella cryptocerci]